MKSKTRKSIKEEKKEYQATQQNYFEGVVQLRNFNEQQLNEIIDFIEENECKIAKHIEQKEGVDIYLSSQKFIQHLAKWVKDKYNVNVTLTRTLHTRDTKANKDLYRVTACIRFLSHKVGDIIDHNGDKVVIKSLGKNPTGKMLDTGKRVFLNPNELM